MRATQSGGYRFDGVVLPFDAVLGGPDDYFVEPYFLGGMYRFCAVQVGGLRALMDATVASLVRKRKANSPLYAHRVGAIGAALTAATAVTERLARMIQGEVDPPTIAREAVLSREVVERSIVSALEIAERCLGTEAHREKLTRIFDMPGPFILHPPGSGRRTLDESRRRFPLALELRRRSH